MTKEIWRPHPTLPCLVSNTGRVSTIARTVKKKNRWGRTGPLRVKAKILVSREDRNGYLTVDIPMLNGSRKCYSIHRLVLETFSGPCPPGMVCRHFPDRDKKNNNTNNLQWGTYEENQADSFIHGTRATGTRNGRHALSIKTQAKIKEMREAGQGYRQIARSIGVGHSTIWNFLNGKTYPTPPRDEMRRQLLPEISGEIARREEPTNEACKELQEPAGRA